MNIVYGLIALGLIAALVGLFLSVKLLWIVGIVALIIGGVLLVLSLFGVGPVRNGRGRARV